MLKAYIEAHPHAFGTDVTARDVLLGRIERRRRRLRRRALELGASLYKRKPAKFTRRLGTAFSR
jgi:hypothetical protein